MVIYNRDFFPFNIYEEKVSRSLKKARFHPFSAELSCIVSIQLSVLDLWVRVPLTADCWSLNPSYALVRS